MNNIKKITIILVAICVSFSLSAQLKVHQSGNVGIKTTAEANSPLTIGENAGSVNTAITATGEACGAYIIGKSTTCNGDSWCYGLRTDVMVRNNMVAAIDGRAMLNSPISLYKAIGVRGVAGNATPGYNFGVFGMLSGSNGGAAVYGTVSSHDWATTVGTGRYAGYFRGNVYVLGVVTSSTSTTFSDMQYKKNIRSLSSQPKALSL